MYLFRICILTMCLLMIVSIQVLVSLDEQRAYVYRNGIQIGYSTESTGKKEHETPTGFFTTLQKDAGHHFPLHNNTSLQITQTGLSEPSGARDSDFMHIAAGPRSAVVRNR